MNLEEKKERLIELAGSMKEQPLLFAQSLAKGSTQTKAYLDAGYASETPRIHACQLLVTNSNVNEYVETSKEIAAEEAQAALNYSEEDWLRDSLSILRMATGEAERVETAVVEGVKLGEITHKKVELAVAKGMMELLGKRYGLLTDKTENKTDIKFEGMSDDELNTAIAKLTQP